MAAGSLYLATLVAIVFVGVVSIVAFVFYKAWIKSLDKTQSGGAATLSRFMQRSMAYSIVTVVLVIFSVLFLTVVGKFEGAAASIISGIVGYVLGRNQSKGKQEKEEDAENPESKN